MVLPLLMVFSGGFPGLLAGLTGGLVSTDIMAKPVGKNSEISKSGHMATGYDFVTSKKKT